MTKEGGKWGREGQRRDYFGGEGGSYEEARKEKTERILEWVLEAFRGVSIEDSNGTSNGASNGTVRETPREKKTGI